MLPLLTYISVYALIAVPVMTSFAIQTVISTMSYFSRQMLTRRGKRMNSEARPDIDDKSDVHSAFPPHGQLVLDAHQKVKEAVERRTTESSGSGDEEREDELSLDIAQVLSLATKLEGHARRLLVGHLCSSGDSDIHLAGNLLKADWNVQRREILTVVGDQSDLNIDLDGDGKGDFLPGAQSDMQTGVQTGVETLEEVKQYRIVFAEFLAAAAALQRLEGKRQLIFERRREDRKY
jgi:potassium channel subfamily K